jgi:hypothetical protein
MADRSGIAFIGGVGALAGLSLTSHLRPRARVAGTVAGTVVLVASESVARRRQRPDEIPALWHRIVTSGAMAAPLGWLAGRLSAVGPVGVGAGAGAVAGWAMACSRSCTNAETVG